jgi:rhomboid protease GluP
VFAAITIVLGFQIAGIDNGAHIGGFVAGLLAGAALARPLSADDKALLGRYRTPHASPGQALAGFTLVAALVLLVIGIPSPRYRWSEEVMARGEISEFIGEDQRIADRWTRLIDAAQTSGTTFDDLAGRIESEVAQPYQQSFEELSDLQLSPEAPSAAALANLRRYAETRRDASRALVEGLRAHDMERVREALEQASRPPPPVAAPEPPGRKRD